MTEALLIIDVQNDFTPPHGALAVPEGDQVIDEINELAASERFELVVATRDWHPPDHASFASQGGPWVQHCVRETPGAQLHPALDRSSIHVVVDKGTDRMGEGYSAFETGELRELLRSRGVDAVTITGLAADFCVRHTARDALLDGLRVTIPTTTTRGIDADETARALAELLEAGAEVV